MKKATGVIILLSVFLCAFSSIAGKSENKDDYSDMIFYTVKRDVFYGYFERSSDSDEVLYIDETIYVNSITFTKVFMRSKSTGRTELLFEMKNNIWDLSCIEGSLYFWTNEGLLACDIDGRNLRTIVDGNISCFTEKDSTIYYGTYEIDPWLPFIMKCDLDGGNKTVVAERVWADKLTVVDGGIIFSDMSSVGIISSDGGVNRFITNLVVPMPGGGDLGTHFVVNDYLIITGYSAPEDEKYGRYPTLICDLNGNILDVWENIVVRNIAESNGYVYASITDSGTYLISRDFKDRTQAPPRGFMQLYIESEHVFFNRDEAIWYRSDILIDGTFESWEAEPVVEYPNDIEVLVMDEKPLREVFPDDYDIEYRGELLTFDVPPAIIDGEVLLPLRKVFQSMGAKVDWDDEKRTATVTKGNVELVLEAGSSTLLRNGDEVELDIPPQIVNNRLLVPLQALSYGFGARANWDERKNSVWVWYS